MLNQKYPHCVPFVNSKWANHKGFVGEKHFWQVDKQIAMQPFQKCR